MLDAQLFLQPHLVSHKERSLFKLRRPILAKAHEPK